MIDLMFAKMLVICLTFVIVTSIIVANIVVKKDYSAVKMFTISMSYVLLTSGFVTYILIWSLGDRTWCWFN